MKRLRKSSGLICRIGMPHWRSMQSGERCTAPSPQKLKDALIMSIYFWSMQKCMQYT